MNVAGLLEELEGDQEVGVLAAAERHGVTRPALVAALGDQVVAARFAAARPAHPLARVQGAESAVELEAAPDLDHRVKQAIRGFASTGNFAAACVRAQIAPRRIWRMIDPDSPSYDPRVADAYFDAESLRVARLEDSIWEKIEKGEATDTMMRALLEARRKEVYNRAPNRSRNSGKGGGITVNVALVQQEARSGLMRVISESKANAPTG